MSGHFYRFGNFELDVRARELRQNGIPVALTVSAIDCLRYLVEHRVRPVGRDELVSAVWGKAEVGESMLGHTIVLLRKQLGDTREQQHSIRTLPRLGYRWVADTTVDESVSRSVMADAKPAHVAAPDRPGTPAGAAARSWSRVQRAGFAFVGASGVIIIAVLLMVRGTKRPEEPIANLAMVLPARVEAPIEWSWLRYGLMDLVNTQMRRGALQTVPSETVVALVHTDRAATRLDDASGGGDDPIGAQLVMQPTVALTNGLWTVRLDAVRGPARFSMEERSADVISAARSVTDTFLIRMGKTPQIDSEGEPSALLQQLLQQVRSARLSEQYSLADSLLQHAPPEFAGDPQLTLSAVTIDVAAGRYAEAQKKVESLLANASEQTPATLRAEAFSKLGLVLLEGGKRTEAEPAFKKVLSLVESGKSPQLVADALSGLGAVALARQQLDEAQRFYGHAREMYDSIGDLYDTARVDMNLGVISGQRGQYGASADVFAPAADRFEKIGAMQMRLIALINLATSQWHAGLYADELATTDRFWPPSAKSESPRIRWHTTLSRSGALAHVGRLKEAEDLLQELTGNQDIGRKEPAIFGTARGIQSYIAYEKEDYEHAALIAKEALGSLKSDDDWETKVELWNYQILSLQRGGNPSQAKGPISEMDSWARSIGRDSPLVSVEALQAEQASVDGRTEDSRRLFIQTLEKAEKLGDRPLIERTSIAYVDALLDSGLVDEAMAICGRIAQWGDADWRVALMQARVYAALGNDASASTWLMKTKSLAGERPVPSLDTAVVLANLSRHH